MTSAKYFRFYIFFAILSFNTVNIFAIDGIKIHGAFAYLNGELNLYDDNIFELSSNIGIIYFEHTKTHLGLQYDLLKISVFYHKNADNNYDCMSFFNPTIYWNILSNKNNILGPFISINYLILENPLLNIYSLISKKELSEEKPPKFYFDKIDINAGIRVLWEPVWDDKHLPLWMIGSEFGYKYQNNKAGLYINFSINFQFWHTFPPENSLARGSSRGLLEGPLEAY